MLALYRQLLFAKLLLECKLPDFGLKFRPPPGVVPRPAPQFGQIKTILWSSPSRRKETWKPLS